MLRPLQGTLSPLGRATAVASSWWLSGGISASACVAAYAPKGAASLAASYTNLANPGTYDAAPGVAPTFNAATGWTFNGSTQYLTTGIVPASGYSMIIRFANGDSRGGDHFICGSQGATANYSLFFLAPFRGASRTYASGHEKSVSGTYTSGVMAVAGSSGYINGSLDTTGISGWTQVGAAVHIGAFNPFYAAWAGDVIAFAIYSTDIGSYIGSLTTAMNAL